MKKIRIGYLIDTMETARAGTESQLLETIKRLDRKQFEPLLICLYHSAWLDSNSLPCKSSIQAYEGFLKLSFPRVLWNLRSIIRHEGIQILQTFFEDSIFVGFFAGWTNHPRPILLSSRRDIGLGKNRPWYHTVFKRMLPLVNKGFDGIICNSRNVKEYVVSNERVPKSKVKIIPNGVTVPPFLEPEPELFRHFQSDVWIGVVANLKPVKRIDVFLKALSILKESTSTVSFRAVIIGDGLERARLVELSERLGLSLYVHFVGSVPSVTGYLQRIDIGVLPSDREGLSNAVLEYMACALPVVVTAVGGNPELVDNANGFCVPPDDPEALARALFCLISDPQNRKNMGRQSLQKVREHFSWDQAVQELEAYYQSLFAIRHRF